MQIKPIASNMTELTFTPKETTAYGDFSVLYSYQTPVAGYSDEGAFRTDTVSYTHLTLPTKA